TGLCSDHRQLGLGGLGRGSQSAGYECTDGEEREIFSRIRAQPLRGHFNLGVMASLKRCPDTKPLIGGPDTPSPGEQVRGNVRYSIIFGLNENLMSDTPHTTAQEPEPVKTGMEIGDVLKILPHRYPFLLIDRVVELVRMKSIVALKNVTITEPFFQGHFPEKPIMPGVLIVEAIAQAGGLLLLTEVPNRDEMLMVFTGIEKA